MSTLKRSVAERVQAALAATAHESASVAAFCRHAGISRNTLYRYYPQALNAIRRRRRQRAAVPGEEDSTIHRLRSQVQSMHTQAAKLASLVDHYFAAYRDVQGLLERRDRELSQLRRSAKSWPIALRRAVPHKSPSSAIETMDSPTTR
jgi:AcrR family transcriptional regulator